MQTKGGRNIWLFGEAKHGPKATGSQKGGTMLSRIPFVHARGMLRCDLQENDMPMHDPIVPDVQLQGRRHEVRFLGEVDRGAIHAFRCSRLVERGDEGRKVNGVLVALFESDAPALSPHEHEGEGNESDKQWKPASRRNFVNVGGHESEVEQKEQRGDREDEDRRPAPQSIRDDVTNSVVTIMSPATAIP
jgi:hypothetical protein